jgi:hypothetical protein
MDKDTMALLSSAIEKGDESLNTITGYLSEMKYEEQRRIANIALAKAQAEFPKVDENATAGGRYKYATLDNMLGLIGPVLNRHGFAYSFDSHWTDEGEERMQNVYARLHHEGGHIFVATVRSPIDKQARMNESQKAGSALSYGKRYAFAAVSGCATGEDDDAQAQGKPEPRRQPVRQPKPQPPQSAEQAHVEAPVVEGFVAETHEPQAPNMAQLKRLHTIANQGGWSADQVKAVMFNRWGVMSSKELSLPQYNELCDTILPGGPSEDVPAGDSAA